MICAQVRAHPAVDFFVVPHWDREHAVGEWGATFQREGKHNLCAFDRALVEMFGSQRAVDAAPLYFLGTFVRRVDSEALGAAFRAAFDAMVNFGLRRDQNVLPFALWSGYGRATSERVLVCGNRFQDHPDACGMRLKGIGCLGCRPAPGPPANATGGDLGRAPRVPCACALRSRKGLRPWLCANAATAGPSHENESHAAESRADDGPSEDAVQAAARAAAAAVAAALANSTATVRAALAEGAARGVEVAAARDRARAAPRRDSGATYCGQRPGYRCRGHGGEKRCHPDASCN